jgi:decaprenyl-phosphate phosphoribosyltransferase
LAWLLRLFFLLRAHHWTKNLFIFIPAFFAGQLLDSKVIISLSQGFICFCLVASGVYILNDYRDIETDKLHPKKKNRPLASGKVPIPLALGLMIVLFVASVGWAYAIKPLFAGLIVLYAVINLGYSFGLKNISLLDIFLLSSGFLIRTIAGGILINVYISEWLIIMVFLLSIFLAFAKRRDDLVLAQKSGVLPRLSARQYTIEFINTCLSLISGIIIVSYIMYTVSQQVIERTGHSNMYGTSLFVLAGLLRYLQITLVNNDSGSPTRVLLTDPFVQLTLVGWVISFLLIIYVF